jgi:hypothetical protein
VSLPCSKEPAPNSYLQPNKFNSQPLVRFIYDPFQYYPLFYTCVTKGPGFLTEAVYIFFLCPASAICPIYLIFTAMMNLLLCSVSHFYVTFFFLFPNIPPRNLFSYSFKIVNQISSGPLPFCCQFFVCYHRITLNYET